MRLFPDTELAENFAEHPLVVDLPTDPAERIQGAAEIRGQQFIGRAGDELRLRGGEAVLGCAEIMRVAGVDGDAFGR